MNQVNVSGREFPVEREHSHPDRDGVLMTKTEAVMAEVVGTLDIGNVPFDQIKWTKHGSPGVEFPLFRTRRRGVEIWLVEGSTPETLNGQLAGHVRLKLMQVTKHRESGDEVAQFFNITISPPQDEGAVPSGTVIVANSRRGLPNGFREDNDFALYKGEDLIAAVMVR